MNRLDRLLTTSLIACAISSTAIAGQPLALIPAASVEIPHSSGKFDFLRIDSKRHRLLAAHEKDGTADIVDLEKHVLLTRLKLGEAVDTAIDADSSHYYVSVQGDERVAVVDASTLKEVNSIKMPGPTDAIIYQPKNHRLYVAHDNGAELWVIDPALAKVVATIGIPGVPEFMVYDATTNWIYVNIKSKDLVVVIDPAFNRVIAQWTTAPALQPHGLALDEKNHQILSAGGNGRLVAIDTGTGKVTATADIVPKVDQIAFDDAGRFAYCAGADKMTILKVGVAALTPLGDLITNATAKNVAVDPATHQVWTTYTDGKSSYAKAWMPPKF